jgi:hypothetical protein
MKRFLNSLPATLRQLLWALAVTMLAAGAAAAPKAPPMDENDLLNVGFKVLVPTTKAQQDWVERLAPGEIRAMQRTGKKYFIYPDASRKQVYVGGPREYEAYVQIHPENRVADAGAAEKAASAYRMKQADAMQNATARDLSNPFLGVTWADLGWY